MAERLRLSLRYTRLVDYQLPDLADGSRVPQALQVQLHRGLTLDDVCPSSPDALGAVFGVPDAASPSQVKMIG